MAIDGVAESDVAGATPWESVDVQLERVRRFVVSDLVAAIGGLALLTVFFLVWQPSWVYAPIAAVLISIGVLIYSLRLLRERRLSAAIFAIAASFWFVIPAITFVLPPAFAAFALATVWPVLLATPYVDSVALRRLAYVTFPVALLSLGLSFRGDPFGVEETLGSTVLNLSLLGIGVAFALLTLLMIWAYNSRLQDTLTGLHETNARLAANERQLEAKVAERTTELESASAYLKAVIQNLPQGLATLDENGRLLERNEAFLEQFDDHGDMTQLADLPSELQQLVEAIGDTNTPSDHSVFVPLSGERVGKAMATPITLTGQGTDDTNGAVVLVDDVTAERQVDRMKTDFISTVSHELRTPLTSVLGFARIIQKRLDDKIFPYVDTDGKGTERAIRQVGDNLNVILEEGGRLTNLINDVLDISKMEARQVDWNFQPTSLRAIVDTAVTATASLFEGGPVAVRNLVDEELPAVHADYERLVQVAINLLSNAQKFTEEGEVTVDGAVDSESGSVVLTVSDTGIGVAHADLPLLFERFRQVGDSLTDRPTGTGLGLPICREIVQAHGGTIEAESELGSGTTFIVRLPLAKTGAAAQEIIPFEPTTSGLATTGTTAESRSRTKDDGSDRPHVLIVDDDDGIRSLLRDLFESEGYRTSEAPSGEVAVRLATTERPDLITLDVLMPGMSGIDTALALRTSVTTATTPLVFVSVLDRLPEIALGVDGHLTKPIDTDRLLELAAELVERDRSTDDTVVVIDASPDVLAAVVDGLERFGYDTVDELPPADAGGVRLVIANGQTDAGLPELRRWTFRRDDDFLVVVALETDTGSTQETLT